MNQPSTHSRAVLPLIEQTLMILIFMLAAAVCVQAFVHAYLTSTENRIRGKAAIEVQSAYEVCKAYRGDLAACADILGGTADAAAVTLTFNEDMERDPTADDYILIITAQDSGQPLLGAAQILVQSSDGAAIYSAQCAWQEVASP